MVGSGRMHSWISGKLLTARSILDEPHSPWSVSLFKNRTVDERPVCSAVIVVCQVPESTEVYISKRRQVPPGGRRCRDFGQVALSMIF